MRRLLAVALSMAVPAGVLAATGEFAFVTGQVTLAKANGQRSTPAKGTPVDQGDTITTGADGMVQLTMADQARLSLRPNTQFLVERYGEGVRKGSFSVHSNRDMGAALASGSHLCDAMAIVPCSMKTLAGIANGLSRSLIERAADVMLKERRRLVLVPRETPMSLPQLKNMVAAAEAGAMILPAMPAFYQKPQTIDDLADFIAGRILNALGFEQTLFTPWRGE